MYSRNKNKSLGAAALGKPDETRVFLRARRRKNQAGQNQEKMGTMGANSGRNEIPNGARSAIENRYI